MKFRVRRKLTSLLPEPGLPGTMFCCCCSAWAASVAEAPSRVDDVWVGVACVTVCDIERARGDVEGSESTSTSSANCHVESEGCSRHS